MHGRATVFLLLLVSACMPAIGAGVAVTVAGGAALLSDCHDYLNVAVYDETNGSRVCDARVVVTDGDGFEELGSCYRTMLGEGDWTVVVSKPGFDNAKTVVRVEHPDGCSRSTQSVRLMIAPPGYSAAWKAPSVVPVTTPIAPAPASTPQGPIPAPASSSAAAKDANQSNAGATDGALDPNASRKAFEPIPNSVYESGDAGVSAGQDAGSTGK
jgi:hypothetical protein